MFEGLVRQLILGYLGQYIKDIQKEQLKITLWNEEVLLENVELILEAFDYLRLPFAFKQGRVGKLSIKIPWKKLGWDPIIIILEEVYICVSQRDDTEWCMDAVERREYASKKAQLAAAELAKLSRRVCDNQTGKSFISYITAKILDSIQVSIRNVHVLYRDTLSAKVRFHPYKQFLFPVHLPCLFCCYFNFSYMYIFVMFRSSSAKLRGGQVNKLIEVQNLELYYDTFEKTDDSNTENVVGYKNMGRELLKEDNYSSLLAPLNVSVSLSVNRSGKLLNDAPQYNMDVELARVTTLMDEVQLQQILSLCDYMSLSRLREKYGRYRPWWSPIGKRMKGWQKLWWHYAQKSVLSDVRRSLRKTSWKYLGERLNSRRKYVNLYKAKLKCLRHDQVVEEDVQHILEEMEKETDIDDILNYRSVAECELEVMLLINRSLSSYHISYPVSF
ncbi:PREDICTED: putative vacuolar protein sorting-associated protein 13B [Erythranthe guttata]|uniref:putative vacuolar protein sorting-associated protein 13B n=1 Tax=Erythranthe guttata TaxID=4155 RepID=UPI00064DE1A0|nr:PREDICTED: putative vacuolar protein sorting-associated protein 13B [Erythranthe guttata]|eukprot:XP_012848280.1 PREDICTED: putative vacuolar protein sorting-associated protein 13B [Erythranthe guttata]